MKKKISTESIEKIYGDFKQSFTNFKDVSLRHVVAPSAIIETLGDKAQVAVMNSAVVYSCQTQTATIKVIHGCSFGIQREYSELIKAFHDQYRLFLYSQRNNLSQTDIVKNRIYDIHEELTRIRDNILQTSVEFVQGSQAGNKIIFELADGQILSTITTETMERHKFFIEKKGVTYDICVKNSLEAPELFEEYDCEKCS
jgi:hypothetical protein